ncbi:MAG TPA: condensation domain-containing protein [Mycobacteriales bacterium]|nr:condensation domain-containing protein [Mycobacteriales bacterium]
MAGVGLARGYLRRPGRTAGSFLPDPHSPIPGARMYRTGDLVVWEPDGRLGFRGRADRQVKVAGQRLEIGEVEAVLAAHPAVSQVAVDLVPGPAGPELVAYLAPAGAPDAAALRAFCADRLPVAALPARVVRLAALPLNASSKVDLRALRSLADADQSHHGAHGGAPGGAGSDGAPAPRRPATTPAQRTVAAAWARVFGRDEPDLDADFLDSGGNSLLAMRLVAALRAGAGRDVAVADVFSGRTPEGIAALLDRTAATGDAPVPVGEPATLSGAQRRLWFLDRLAPGSAYNIAVAERLRGPLDATALARALAALADRHAVLRWRVPDDGGIPRVVVEPPAPVPLPVTDLAGTGDGAGDPERVLAEGLRAEAGRRFDLAAGPLWRARLFRLGPDHHVLALTLHHLVFDGWSLALLYRDLSTGYRATARPAGTAGTGTGDGPARPGYADYVSWLAARQAGRGATDLAWWLDRLAGVTPVLDLPRDRARPPVQAHLGAQCHTEVPESLAGRVYRLAGALSVTPYAVLLAAFALLLRRLTGATDLIVGVPAADRRHPDFDDLVGFFVDTLPVRLRVDDGASFAAQVRDCAGAVLDAMAHRDAPFDRIVDGLRLPRDLSCGPLVQVLFNMYNFAGARLDLPGVRADALPAGLPGSLFDLTLYATGRGGGAAPGQLGADPAGESGIDLQAVYNPDLYSAARVAALLDTYLALLGELCAAPDRAVGAAPARPASSALPRPDRPLMPARPVEGLLERVERVAARWPDVVALTGAGGGLDYATLVRSRAVVTRAIRHRAYRTDSADRTDRGGAVGVLAARTTLLPALLLGVLASGRRWLVLDPAHPADRLRRQVAAAGVRLVLACGAPTPATLDALDGVPGVEVVEVDPAGPGPADPGVEPPVPFAERGYLMATSGTTGEPSLVVCQERPLAAFLDWYTDRFDISRSDSTALLAGLGHDPLLRDAFVPLITGGRVCVPDQAWLRDPDRMLRWLAAERVTVLHLTPQLARLLAAADTELPGVRLAVFGGDRLTDHDVAAARRWLPAAVLVNGYGTTETPQLQSLHVLAGPTPRPAAGSGPHPVPVGRGAPGTDLVVAGPSGAPAAVGELGEVLVRGPNLAEGYLNRPAGSDPGAPERFGVNPWTRDKEDRVYRTGDVGRHDPDGDVVLAGRSDDQVKVRGHRVGLGEVEAALAGHPDVVAAVAVSRVEAGETTIVAYAVPCRVGVRPAALRDHLRQRLPEYACPSAVVVIPELPLGPNGKVDRAGLPPPPVLADAPAEAGSAPATRTERVIAGVWREVLGRPTVSVTDNFFEIGGHSLAIVAVQSRLKALLGRPVNVVDLFRFPNVRALAGYLDGGTRGAGLDRADRRIAARRERRRPGGRTVREPGG